MHILTVTHYFDSNGAGVEIIAARIREQLMKHGHRVRWIAARACNRVTLSVPTDAECIGIPMWDKIRVWTDLAWPLPAPAQLGIFRDEVSRADLIHLHEPFYPACQIALRHAARLNKPVVITQHIADMPVPGRLRRSAVAMANAVLTRPAHRRASRVVFYSTRTQSFFRNSVHDKALFIHNGCDTGIFHPATECEQRELRHALAWPDNRPVVLFVGRFIAKKGLHLLQAAARKFTDCLFVCIGRGPLHPAAWNLSNVLTLPPCDHVGLSRYYRAADLLALPATGEGFPLVVQEAICCGLPCLVSTEIAEACPEMRSFFLSAGTAGSDILTGISGYLPRPMPRAMRLAMAAHGRQLWSWETCGRHYHRLFENLTAKTTCK